MPEIHYAECAEVDAQIINTAAELIGCVRDYSPDETAAVLDPLSVGHLYQLAVVLAAAVDPDKPIRDLLSWTKRPVHSRSFEPASMRTDRAKKPCPDCGGEFGANNMGRHRRTHSQAA